MSNELEKLDYRETLSLSVTRFREIMDTINATSPEE
jgi:hypothetical protein